MKRILFFEKTRGREGEGGEEEGSCYVRRLSISCLKLYIEMFWRITSLFLLITRTMPVGAYSRVQIVFFNLICK